MATNTTLLFNEGAGKSAQVGHGLPPALTYGGHTCLDWLCTRLCYLGCQLAITSTSLALHHPCLKGT
jgi:hypothetical protein